MVLIPLNSMRASLTSIRSPRPRRPCSCSIQHLHALISYSYIGADFPKILNKPEVDYKQANLTVPCASTFLARDDLAHLYTAMIPSLFDPPEGQDPYDYVFDLTGEVRQDRTEMVRPLSRHHLISFPSYIPQLQDTNHNDMQRRTNARH